MTIMPYGIVNTERIEKNSNNSVEFGKLVINTKVFVLSRRRVKV